ncbi:uncharacterized protein LOC141655971 [Silene latifolia]|uniref:uncharacterized protein LOC141655971 n=1 Tax=Silene latifolia TaxID=37657 RepID=UPI003D770BCF
MSSDKYRLPSLAEVPWLIATHGNKKSNKLEKQTFRTNTNSCWKTIPELHRNIIVAAHQGWLILRDRKNYSIYSLWNPVTSQFLRLPELLFAPELEDDVVPSICLLTDSPDLDNNNNPETTCKLVLFFHEGLAFSCTPTAIHRCSWVKQRLEHDSASKVEIETACVLEGVIYGYAACTWGDNSFERKFVRINFARDTSNSITLNPMIVDHLAVNINFQSPRLDIYMVESCGVLYYIRLMLTADDDMGNMDIIKAWVWRLDFLQMQWIKVTSLRNRAFLLGSHSCTWCWAGTRSSSSSGGFIEENCMYFSIIGSQQVYSYDLQDDSYTILLPHSSSRQMFYGPTWFMPGNHNRLFTEWEVNQMISEETEQIKNINQQVPEWEGKQMFELPLDVLQSVMKFVNLFDYMNLRATCKRLHAENPLEQWRANSRYPLFMVRMDNSGTYELFDPFENVSHTVLTFKKSSEFLSYFEYCKDGWLLSRSEEDTLQYVNPFKRETGMYPPCEMDCATFGFSTCPNSSDCLIVGIAGWGKVRISCFDASYKEWEYFEMGFNSDEDIPFYANHKTSPVYYKNAFYFLGTDGCLGELKFLEQVSWHVYKFPFPTEGTKLNSSYLVELDGELVSVFIGKDGSWVKVFKFNFSDNCWMRVETLGQHVLFVSSVSSFSIKSEKSVMKNRIYLPLRKDNEIVFYSLDTGKYHTSGSANSIDNFYGMKVQSSCCWI